MDLIDVVALNYMRFNKPRDAKPYLEEFEKKNSFELSGNKDWRDYGKNELEKLEKFGAEIIPFYSKEFPKQLLEIKQKPLLLYVKGSLKEFPIEAIAIVGSRKCTSYGKGVSYKLSYELGKLGVCVISGLAYGIDSEAHRGAIESNGTTIAVLGNGVNEVYPKEHLELYKEIEAKGLLVSEFPLGSKPTKYNFPFRNRLISGLGLAVVVVEAEVKSGSLITAMHALEQGKEVFAVPGNITSKTSMGANELIRDGAIPVLGVEDIIDNIPELKHLSNGAIVYKPSKEEDAILSQIEDGDTFDTILEKVAKEERELLMLLTLLEMKGLIKKASGRYFKA
ncbi:MAG: DNA-processing protein DprA [Candidatus Atribacteria bacterium]|nr:DNA-processing protein DprA [Candidatus Atribacteria bacterium]